MLEIVFAGIIPLAVLFAFALWVVVFVHELGHAIPILLLSKEDAEIYIGSYGDAVGCVRVSFGRLNVYCKKNPLAWFKGCCVYPTYGFSLNDRILITAGGPIASLLLTAVTWGLVSATQDATFWRVVAGGVFFISAVVTFAILIPVVRVRYTESGMPVYHDVYQIYVMIRSKYRGGDFS